MRVLIADKLAPFVAGALQDLGAEVAVDAALDGPTLATALTTVRPEVLVVRSTKVAREAIAASPSLALVVRAGAGVNTIDLTAASERGVYVANCPGKNAAAVAELAFAHLLNLDRRIADNVSALRQGTWNKKEFGRAQGLRGRTLAVLGVGAIGRLVIARAHGFGMNVVAWSRSLSAEDADTLGVTRASSPEEAVRSADAVTIHLALAKDTRHRIGASVFASMRHGAYFVNTSRAEVVDTAALTEAIERQGLRVGLDVFADEPSSSTGDFRSPLASHPQVYGTHHIGASTEEAEEAVGADVVAIVRAYRDGAPIPHCVNLARSSPATHLLVVRHEDRVGVLARLLGVLREAGHNVQEMQNIVFDGAAAACARIAIVGAPTPATIEAVERDAAVFSASFSALPSATPS